MANHDVWDTIEQTDGTPANSFEWILRIFSTPTVFVDTADITGVSPAFTGKTRNRETYAAKGKDRGLKYADNLVLSWNHEAVRDEQGQFQPELQMLLDASKALGMGNIVKLALFDALGADYAYQARFSISVAPTNGGWDEAGFFTITATSYDQEEWITNPVLDGLTPSLSNVSPAEAAGGAHVYIQGVNFFKEGVADVIGATSVKFGSTNATSYTVISDTLIDAIVPGTGAAPTLPITVTNSDGVSAPIDFARLAA